MKLHGCRILPFRGYGTTTELHLSGRVLHRSDDPPVVERFETDELVNGRVRVRVGEHSTELTTDDEGLYRGLLGLADPLTAPRAWHESRSSCSTATTSSPARSARCWSRPRTRRSE